MIPSIPTQTTAKHQMNAADRLRRRSTLTWHLTFQLSRLPQRVGSREGFGRT